MHKLIFITRSREKANSSNKYIGNILFLTMMELLRLPNIFPYAVVVATAIGVSVATSVDVSEAVIGGGGVWSSVTPNVDFKAVDVAPQLRPAQRRALSIYDDNFADGMGTKYDEYSQAWRMLGFYTDCNAYVDDEEGEQEEERRRRRLDENNEEEGDNEDQEDENNENEDEAEDDQGDEENDEGDEEDDEEDDEEEENEEDDNNNNNNDKTCKRYMLWAAYVDVDYSGGGLAEYKIYNTSSRKWDNTACKSVDGRCVKMDCHNRGSSHFKLLGYFREKQPVDFLNTLLAHQGSCTWDGDDVDTVTNSLDWLPQECTATGVKVQDSKTQVTTKMYFDLKPTSGGGVNIGLYSDPMCSSEYTGRATTVNKVLSAYHGEEIVADSAMKNINTALDAFKVCTPCRTYDLSNANGNNDGGNFACQDDDGNNGVNQCMLFAEENTKKASFNDVSMASVQGTIQRTFDATDKSATWWESWRFFFLSVLGFFTGIFSFCAVAVKRKRVNGDSDNKQQPLMDEQ